MTSSEYARTKPSINIVNTNYSKYGTSVYQQLYHSKYHDARRNNSRLAAASSNNTVPSSQLFATESLDSELMMDDDSTTSRFRKKYRSLLQNYNGSSSKAKRLINKLHDYGSVSYTHLDVYKRQITIHVWNCTQLFFFFCYFRSTGDNSRQD